jgi:hypothetical protein
MHLSLLLSLFWGALGCAPCSEWGDCVGSSCVCRSNESMTIDCNLTRSGCSALHCSLKGECLSVPVGSVHPGCVCHDGYHGASCEYRSDHCSALLCSGIGQCVTEMGAVRCACPTGLHGDCSVCDGHQNHYYRCGSCVAERFGEFCDKWPRTCARERCNNRGSCTTEGCVCRGAWRQDSNCRTHSCPGNISVDTDQCVCSWPTVPTGGTCSRPCSPGSYNERLDACECPVGRWGLYCQYHALEDASAPPATDLTRGWVSLLSSDLTLTWAWVSLFYLSK